MFAFLTETEMMVFARSFILFMVCEILISIIGMFLTVTDAKSGTDFAKNIMLGTITISLMFGLGFIIFGLLSLLFFAIF